MAGHPYPHTCTHTNEHIKCITTDYGGLDTHTLLDNRLYHLTIIIQYVFSDNINNYVLVRSVYGKYSTRGACRETNTARGEAECCICLEAPPECCIFRTHELRRCFNCYIAFLVLSGPIEPSQSSK